MVKHMRKRLLLLFSAVIITGGYTLGWFYLAHRLQNRVELLVQQGQQKGWQVTYQDLRVTGYPFQLNVIVDKLEVSYKGIIKSWVDGQMSFSAALWRPQQITSWAGGKHHVTLSLLTDNIVHCEGEGFMMQLPALDPKEFEFSYENLNLFIADKLVAEVGAIDMSVKRFSEEADTDKDEGALMGLTFSLEELSLPALAKVPFGQAIDQIKLQATLNGDLTGETIRQGLQSWYESNGTVEVANMTLKWGPLELVAEGTTSLDDNLQPMAAFSARLSGLDKTLQAFVDAGWMDQKIARLTRLGLGFLFETMEGADETTQHRLPVTLQNGQFFLGPIAVSKVPQVSWE